MDLPKTGIMTSRSTCSSDPVLNNPMDFKTNKGSPAHSTTSDLGAPCNNPCARDERSQTSCKRKESVILDYLA